jgi:hypothetical protein
MSTEVVRNLSFYILYDSGYEPLTLASRIRVDDPWPGYLCNIECVSFTRYSGARCVSERPACARSAPVMLLFAVWGFHFVIAVI